jgi:tetratricopeptide (TPR) repeat protein
MRAAAPLLLLLTAIPVLAASTAADVREAEVLARQALDKAATAPAEAEALARRALARTAEFNPTTFVQAGRKGEVVEDAFLSARDSYRRHRALLYEAVGAALLAKGEARPASRYLRRALVLEPETRRVELLVRALLDAGLGAEALHLLHVHGHRGLPADLFARAADALGLPSAQLEIDRAQLRPLAPAVAIATVPVALPPSTRSSTGGPFAWDTAPTVVYVSDDTCRTCSADLEALSRILPAGARVAVTAADPDRDHALRQVMSLYRLKWPVIVGRGVAQALPVEPGQVIVVARGGWAAVTLKAPFERLPQVVESLSRTGLAERLPRERWNRQPPATPVAPAPLPLTAEGLAPGEDEPAPPSWDLAVAAYRAKRHAEALKHFEALEAQGWLLPPEARIDRALALAGLGHSAEARALLLGVGDSRFQDAADRALENVR